MAKAKKNRTIQFLLLKLLLTILAGLVCYWQFQKIHIAGFECPQLSAPGLFLFMILLMPVNYFFEWMKWRAVVKTFQSDFGIHLHFQAFLAGIITGMLTPNMQGNFLGRMYYYPRRFRLNIVLLTLLSNLAQFWIAIGFGIIAIAIYGVPDLLSESHWLWLLILLLFAAFGFYFTFERLPFPFRQRRFFIRLREALQRHKHFRTEVVLWGTLRHLVFAFQFFLVLLAFGSSPSWELYLTVWQLYLWTTLAPSILLGKLAIRESIALWVFGALVANEWIILTASLSIWCINLLIPTLVGLAVCKRVPKGFNSL